jgi:DNA-binding CsgD family transcriptional regulator
MKCKNDVDFTYMGHLQSTWYANDVTDWQEIQNVMGKFKQFSGLAPYFLPMFFVIDYTRKSYLVFTDNIKSILGYDAREMLDGGLDFMMQIAHKDYFKAINESVFPLNVQFLKRTPQSEHQEYIFSFNNQYRDTGGKWIELLQRSAFITSKDSGLPLYCLGMVIDISIFKRERMIIQSIEKANGTHIGASVVETNYFYPYEEDSLLTRQERNIVQYMAEGLSSKMIAAKLHIAENTVANHRKNTMRKTNTKNVAQLIAFVIRNRII